MTPEVTPSNIVHLDRKQHFDVLPTSNFLSKLPGIDKEYEQFVGRGLVFWNGQSQLNGESVVVRVSHIHRDSTFQVEGNNWVELWELDESRGCDAINFSQKRSKIRGTALNTSNVIDLRNTHWAKLSFCDDESYHMYPDLCEKCPLGSKEQRRRIDDLRANREPFESIFLWDHSKPSDLPIRRSRDVNIKKSRVEGFQSIQEAIDSLINLKDLIDKASPLISEHAAPIPSNQSLISEDYFPS